MNRIQRAWLLQHIHCHWAQCLRVRDYLLTVSILRKSGSAKGKERLPQQELAWAIPQRWDCRIEHPFVSITFTIYCISLLMPREMFYLGLCSFNKDWWESRHLLLLLMENCISTNQSSHRNSSTENYGYFTTTKKRCKWNFKVHSFQVGSECFLFGITDQHASGNNNAFAPGPHLSCDPWSLGINTPHCTHRDCAEAATSLSSQFGCHSLWQRACFLSPMTMQEELSAELMGHHARNRWLTIFCPTCPSSCSKGSSMTMRAPKRGLLLHQGPWDHSCSPGKVEASSTVPEDAS